MMHPNSLAANAIPDKAKQRKLIIALLLKRPGLTRNEIAAHLAAYKIPLSSVCGRVSEMKDDGMLTECGDQIVTHKLADGKTRNSRRSLLKIVNQPEGAQSLSK